MEIDKIVYFNNLNEAKEEKNYTILQNINWSRKQNKDYSSLHSIASYLAMFCPALPNFFIEKYSNNDDIVMDNFSGRGTTALVAREMNRKFIGNDLNPYAIVLSKFKISKVSKSQILKAITILEKKYENSDFINKKIDFNEPKIKEILYFYSESTLRQLLFIRETIGNNWKNISKSDNAVLALALGLMHGPMKKNGETIYFSLDMPNTISMAPNYVKNYAQKNGLTRPKVNIFSQLKSRLNKKYDEILKSDFDAKFFIQDSIKENFKIKNESVTLVVTSPPYLNIVNYKTSNWLKLWLLGYERKKLNNDIKLSDNLKFNEYAIFLTDYLNAIHSKLKMNGKVCLIVGDVTNKKLIEDVWELIKNNVKYKFIEIYYDNKYLQSHKITNMLNSKSGRATKIDKVLVLEKV